MKLIFTILLSVGLSAQARIPGPGGQLVAGVSDTHLRIDTFIADGTWTAPASVTSVLVEAWGAGGDGVNNTGGGGAGEYCKKVVTVVPTTGYAIDVGTASSAASTFDSTTVIASGGASGTTSAAGTGGTGDICFNGGAGSNGTGNRGGGGGAGTIGVGGNSTGNNRGTAGNYFGGQSGLTTNQGSTYGGGGGSATTGNSVGKSGMVRVSYQVNPGVGFPLATAYAYGRSSADVTSHTINLPTCAAGKTLIVFFAINAAPVLSDYTDWTNVIEQARSTQLKILVLQKTSIGGDTLSITSDVGQESTHISACISGVGGTIDGAGTSAFNTSQDPPSLNHGSTVNGLWFAIVSSNQSVTAIPSSYEDFQSLSAGNASKNGIAIVTRHLQASTENPGTFTVAASANGVSLTVCVPGT